MDINHNCSFSLYGIKNKGYAVTTRKTGNIIEIFYGDIPNSDVNYYLGASSFVESLSQFSTKNASDDDIDKKVIESCTRKIISENKIIFDIKKQVVPLSLQKTMPSIISGGKEIGIVDSRMELFSGSYWVNTSNQCGAYVGAAMVSYMDKYFGGNYINEKVKIDSSKAYADYILGRFKNQIKGSTTTYGLINAMNTIMMADYPKGGKHGTATATESTYKSKIKGGRPVALSVVSFKGSPYGNHFVMAYKYVEYNGALWFKAYDNWSGNKNRGWINRNWIQDGTYLN